MTEIKEIDDAVREEIPERIPEARKKKRRTVPVLKSRDGLMIAFFVPVLVMICIFAQRGIFPFGERCFLRTDMYHQYAPFFSEFQHKLRTGGSLLYSWDVGMGVNFAALYAYYLASPLNWLILLCPKKFIIEFMTIMIVLKIGLSGLSFAWYLKKHSQNCILGGGFFGIFYALSGYMAAYSWNIMWLDCILLFPLIVYGLERLVKEQKGMLYCVTLGLSILKLLHLDHDLPVPGALFYRTADHGKAGAGEKIRGQLRLVWNLLAALRRTGSRNPASGDLCAAEHGVR